MFNVEEGAARFRRRVAWLACLLAFCAQSPAAVAGPSAPTLAATAPVMAQSAAADPEPRSLEERRPKTFGEWLARNVLLVALALGLGAAGLGVAVLSTRRRK